MASKTAPKSPPDLSRVLTILRELADWSQADLAKAAGVSPNKMSDLERGYRTVTREQLEELAGLMGFPPETVDESVHFVRSMLPRLQSVDSPGSDDDGQRAQIERLAARIGQISEDGARRILTTFTQEGRAILARQKAPLLWQRMAGRTPSQRRILVEQTPEFRNWALCELICKESIKAAPDDAGRARELADLALLIADLVPGRRGRKIQNRTLPPARRAGAYGSRVTPGRTSRRPAGRKETWLEPAKPSSPPVISGKPARREIPGCWRELGAGVGSRGLFRVYVARYPQQYVVGRASPRGQPVRPCPSFLN